MKMLIVLTMLALSAVAHAAPPISAVAVRNCGKVQGVFVTLDSTHAVRFGGEDRAEYTVKEDGNVDIVKNTALPLSTVSSVAKEATMTVTITVPCGRDADGQSTSFHKVSDEISTDIKPSQGEHQPRTLGQTAVMHIYYYSPKTLEVTYVDSYLFKDEGACKDAVNSALRIAMPLASEGDLVSAQCVGMTPPKGAIESVKPKREGTTDL